VYSGHQSDFGLILHHHHLFDAVSKVDARSASPSAVTSVERLALPLAMSKISVAVQ